jgi:hypothetical protein
MTHPSPDWSLGFGLYSPQGKFAGTYFVIEKIDIFTTFRSIYMRPSTEVKLRRLLCDVTTGALARMAIC